MRNSSQTGFVRVCVFGVWRGRVTAGDTGCFGLVRGGAIPASYSAGGNLGATGATSSASTWTSCERGPRHRTLNSCCAWRIAIQGSSVITSLLLNTNTKIFGGFIKNFWSIIFLIIQKTNKNNILGGIKTSNFVIGYLKIYENGSGPKGLSFLV